MDMLFMKLLKAGSLEELEMPGPPPPHRKEGPNSAGAKGCHGHPPQEPKDSSKSLQRRPQNASHKGVPSKVFTVSRDRISLLITMAHSRAQLNSKYFCSF